MEFSISREHTGLTVLSFLKMKLKISRGALSSLKRVHMGICVNGEHVTVRYQLKEGDLLTINEKDSFDDVNHSIMPRELPLDIIFENDELFILNKPADMPTHPSHNHTEDTLANALTFLYAQRGEPLVFRPIGRLDRNTSGISLIAKNSISASYLEYAKTRGMIAKRYLAILKGQIANDCDWHKTTIYIRRMDDSIIIRCVSDRTDNEAFIAITQWRMLYSNGTISLVEAIPVTGRTHQLRVNFAHLGYPILGDDVYGVPSEYISRHALHAYFLSIPMPYTDQTTDFFTVPPTDMCDAFNKICGMDLVETISSLFKEKK